MMGLESQYNYTTWQVVDEYIPATQLQDYRKKFKSFDDQEKGILPLKDVVLLLHEIGHSVTVSHLSYLLSEVIGVDNRNTLGDTVDFQEFIAIMAIVASNCVAEEEMNLVFRQFDADGDGFITADELRTMLLRLGLGDEISDDELAVMIKAADADGDGRVSYREFIAIMTGSGSENKALSTSVLSSTNKQVEKDINMNDIKSDVEKVEEKALKPIQTTKDATSEKNEHKHHGKSWLSAFSIKKKNTAAKKDLETRQSCPELLRGMASESQKPHKNKRKELRSLNGSREFLFGSLRKKSKRYSSL